MSRSALSVLFSLLFVAFFTTSAAAAENKTVNVKKVTAKKATISSKRVKSVAAKRQLRKTQKNVVRASRNSHIALAKKTAEVQSRRKSGYQRVTFAPGASVGPAVSTTGALAGLHLTRDPLALSSNVAMVIDQATSEVLFEKNSSVALPIASITKLMTSLIVIEANQNMDEILTVTEEDIDREKFTHSRLRVGSQLTRANMLHIALMSSENRAASALGRHYPGGLPAFIAAMNAKAKQLGMLNTHYVDPTGLSSGNVASARDLTKLVVAAYQHPLIRQYSTDTKYVVEPGGPVLHYKNSNHLVENPEWEIGLQKTGYISEAGRCLVMQATIEGRPVIMVFLDSKSKHSRTADAGRIRKWLENARPSALNRAVAQQQS